MGDNILDFPFSGQCHREVNTTVSWLKRKTVTRWRDFTIEKLDSSVPPPYENKDTLDYYGRLIVCGRLRAFGFFVDKSCRG